MKKPTNILIVVATVLACTLVLGTVPTVLAQDSNDATTSYSEDENTSTSTNSEDRKSYLRSANDKNREARANELKREFRETRQEVKRQKLDEKKKRLCAMRSDRINKIMTRVKERSNQRLDRITRIYEAVKAFYDKKDLEVENYSQLVAAVDAAKEAAKKQYQSVSSQPTFSCDSDGPKADIQAFKNAQEDKREAFKAYRSSLVALIKAMHKSVEDKS